MPPISVTPVILCGGSGSRLWPLSRKSLPKQFAPLIGDTSLFERTLKRVDGPEFAQPLVVASHDHRFHVQKQMKAQGAAGDIVLEPLGKNTAPAVIAAALHLKDSGPHLKDSGPHLKDRANGGLMLILPSDHLMPDVDTFSTAIAAGMVAANEGAIVTFGIAPDRPETGYGYIQIDQSGSGGHFSVKSFHEKPSLDRAKAMLAQGGYFWNAGIFLMTPDAVLELAARHQPEMLACTKAAFGKARRDDSFIRPDTASWNEIVGESIDYALIEKAENIACVPYKGEWSDLGDWNALVAASASDTSGNRLRGDVTAVDCQNTTLWSVDDQKHLVGLGLDGIIAIATEDAIMVADANRTQDVRKIVTVLEANNVAQATQHARDYRPWGWFESLVNVPGYQVKRLHVDPGSRLSLQSHKHRSEHWVIVDGTATVVIEDEQLIVEANRSVYIQAGQKHRLSNLTNDPLTVIEVQTGLYLGEDDILRYSDDFNRTETL
jgi:mannose-1-phosphate guanylyltransferase/mannose-6-phosphate isomerase